MKHIKLLNVKPPTAPVIEIRKDVVNAVTVKPEVIDKDNNVIPTIENIGYMNKKLTLYLDNGNEVEYMLTDRSESILKLK